MEYASNPHDLKLMLAAGGQRASGIEQLGARPDFSAHSDSDPGRARGRSCARS